MFRLCGFGASGFRVPHWVEVDNTVQMDTTFNESTMYSIVEGRLARFGVQG